MRGAATRDVAGGRLVHLLALYVAAGRRQGVAPRRLAGTVQNDVLKEYVARGTYIYPPRASLRIVTDVVAFCERELPRWHPISISGYHVREAGSTAAQEIAFTFAHALAYVRAAVDRGLDVDSYCNGRDEALGLPTEEAARIALRTQQIIAAETGVTDTVDPVGGAWTIETLTDRLEAEAVSLLERIDERGGVLAAIESGFIQAEIQEAAYRAQQAVDAGDAVVVGVNRFAAGETTPIGTQRIDPRIEIDQAARVAALRAARDPAAPRTALAAVERAARDGTNLTPPIIAAVEALATVGEIADTLRGVFDEYRAAG